MLNFQFYQKTKVLCGQGTLAQLPELIEHMGATKALIVADPGMMATGVVTKIADAIKAGGKECVVFDENEPNPPIAACEKGYEVCMKENCDCIIGVGGGSNMDCAKGINILRFNPAPLIQYANFAKPFDVGSGLIMIPTTSGTGSEVSDGSILSDENHIKQNFIADGAYADYCILDPELMAGMPPKLTATTAMDALAHACESMTGTLSSPYMMLVGQQVIRDIIEYTPRAVANGNDLVAREKLAVASNVAGFQLVYGHTCAGHSIAQTLGGYYNIPHGAACGYTLPWIMEFNAPGAPEQTKACGEAMGLKFAEDATPEQIGTQIREFLVNFIQNDLKLAPISEAYPVAMDAKLEECADACSKEFFQTFNPRKMTAEDCLDIIKKMYA